MITVKEKHGKDSEGYSDYEVIIQEDGKTIAGFVAYPLWECPEDATLERDMSFAYRAVDFFKLGYEAGKNNKEVEFK